MKIGGGSTRLHYVETSLWMGLWPCIKAHYGLNESDNGKEV